MASMEEAMSKQEMIDWVRTNDLSVLIRDGDPVELSPSSEREVMAVRTVRLSAKVYEELQGLAESRGIGTSVLMRQIIEEWVVAQLTPGGQGGVIPVTELLAFLHRAARPAA
jgi:hypothetical protein